MGSLRNPIGPLPSAVYWRRRIVVLTIALLLILLIVWAVSLVWGDGDATRKAQDNGKGPDGGGPASSITPGPTDDPSATISDRPGGRDEIGGDGGDEDAGGRRDRGGTGGGPGGDPTGDEASDTGGGGGGEELPAGDGLPACAAENMTLELDSVRDEYPPDTRPTIRLTVSNTADAACAVDFAPTAAVVTITDMDDGDTVWASNHCPDDRGARLAKVPAGGSVTHTLTWDRTRSSRKCTTPEKGTVGAGTYQVTARLGELTDQTSFVLAKH